MDLFFSTGLDPMTQDEKTFFKALGGCIAAPRKDSEAFKSDRAQRLRLTS